MYAHSVGELTQIMDSFHEPQKQAGPGPFKASSRAAASLSRLVELELFSGNTAP
jgi:hypothetical protein